MSRTGRSAALLGVLAGCATPHSFAGLVSGIESEYRIERQSIPFVGLASLFTSSAGISDLGLAVFDDLGAPIDPTDDRWLRVIDRHVGAEWRPVVRTHSRASGSWTTVYAAPGDNGWGLLVFAGEPRELTIVRVTVAPGQLEEWLRKAAKDEGKGFALSLK